MAARCGARRPPRTSSSAEAARGGDPRDLVVGRRRADVRVETRGRGRDEVDRDRPVAVRGREPVDVGRDPVDQRLARRPEVRAARGVRVVAVAGRRRAAPEVARSWLNAWPMRLEPTVRPSAVVMSEPLACGGKTTWATAVTTAGIGDARHERQGEQDGEGGPELVDAEAWSSTGSLREAEGA